MIVDPVDSVVKFLRTFPDLPKAVGDLNARNVGDPTLYVFSTGGFRMLRESLDRTDIKYEIYHQDRETAVALAFEVRGHLLSDLPGAVAGNAYVLDVGEVNQPYYDPDPTSREHVYCGEIALFYVQN
ncbi:hypothetical protein [Streptomyces sp. NBC_01500]|uniref:hypothetical protein n=1 Tax=Streptomyces sp. NBC_01500 TaxID=2903886 RepID=UPI002251458E|nr:hypothetical protein [Streptomyces sp. NBC_01500]MCX4554134.1 hypothetical protein [Streptomyces sp. NBC_01500]